MSKPTTYTEAVIRLIVESGLLWAAGVILLGATANATNWAGCACFVMFLNNRSAE